MLLWGDLRAGREGVKALDECEISPNASTAENMTDPVVPGSAALFSPSPLEGL